MTIKKILFSIVLFSITAITKSQILKTNIVEHFTNSNCSVCANVNPGLYSTLSNYPTVLHIAFHPSAPYMSCFFSMQNKIENDARTNFYSLYGSTPRFVVNGTVSSASSINSDLTNVSSSMTNFELKTIQEFVTSDSVLVKVIVKKIAADTTSQALLFVGTKQDTVNQNTGNGESIHHDVFRKSLSLINGDAISLPLNVNDSSVYSYSYKVATTWTASRMQTISILQNNSNKSIINASESINLVSIPLSIINSNKSEILIYPNPASDFLIIKNANPFTEYEIISIIGNVIQKGKIVNENISIRNLKNGQYFIKLLDKSNNTIQNFSIQKK